MSEQKFRVRDVKTLEVVAYEWLENNLWHYQDVSDGCLSWQHATTSYLCPVGIREQFTGLLDKNGVEIYEGDRVQYYSMPEPAETGVVYHGGGMWKIILDDGGGREMLYTWTGGHIRVCGSIHDKETP